MEATRPNEYTITSSQVDSLKDLDIDGESDVSDVASQTAMSIASTATGTSMEEELPFQRAKPKHLNGFQRKKRKEMQHQEKMRERFNAKFKPSTITTDVHRTSENSTEEKHQHPVTSGDNAANATVPSVRTASIAATGAAATTKTVSQNCYTGSATPVAATSIATVFHGPTSMPKPRIVYTKLDFSSTTAGVKGSGEAALLVTLAPLDSTSSITEQRLRQRAINTLGRYKSSVQQQHRAWCEFVTAILDETRSMKLVKDLLRTAQLPSQLSSYKSDPFAQREQLLLDSNKSVNSSATNTDAMATESEEKLQAADTTVTINGTVETILARKTPTRQYYSPRAFFKNADAAFATSNAVFASAHFHQATTMKYIAEQLRQILLKNGIHFIKLEEKTASTEYFSLRFSHEFDESQPFDKEVELLRRELEEKAQLKGFHFDHRALEYDFFDTRTQRHTPQLYVSRGNEAALHSSFFAGRDVEIFVQPATLCYSCGEIYTNALSHQCQQCMQSRRQRAALQSNAGGVAVTADDSYCFKCCKKVPNSHIKTCENKTTMICLRCNSKQHYTLRCPLLRGRFTPISEVMPNRFGDDDGNSYGRPGDRSRYGLGTRSGLHPITIPATSSHSALLSTATPPQTSTRSYASAAAAARSTSSLSEAATTVGGKRPSTVTTAAPTTALLHQELRSALLEDFQPFFQAFQQAEKQREHDRHLYLQALQKLTTATQQVPNSIQSDSVPHASANPAQQSPPQPRCASITGPAATLSDTEAKEPFLQQAQLQELTDAVRDLSRQIGAQSKEISELKKQLVQKNEENARLREALESLRSSSPQSTLSAATSLHTTLREEPQTQRTPKVIRRRTAGAPVAPSSNSLAAGSATSTASETQSDDVHSMITVTSAAAPHVHCQLGSASSSPFSSPNTTAQRTPTVATKTQRTLTAFGISATSPANSSGSSWAGSGPGATSFSFSSGMPPANSVQAHSLSK